MFSTRAWQARGAVRGEGHGRRGATGVSWAGVWTGKGRRRERVRPLPLLSPAAPVPQREAVLPEAQGVQGEARRASGRCAGGGSASFRFWSGFRCSCFLVRCLAGIWGVSGEQDTPDACPFWGSLSAGPAVRPGVPRAGCSPHQQQHPGPVASLFPPKNELALGAGFRIAAL